MNSQNSLNSWSINDEELEKDTIEDVERSLNRKETFILQPVALAMSLIQPSTTTWLFIYIYILDR